MNRLTPALIVAALAVVVLILLLTADYAFGNTINLPYVARSRPEPTIAADATATPWVSVGGPYVPPTLTPTVAPPAMVQP